MKLSCRIEVRFLAVGFHVAGVVDAQTVRGTVVDAVSGTPVQSAQITLLDALGNTHRGPVRSDSAGRFTIHAGGEGTYQLRAMRIGYRPATSGRITFVFGGQVAEANLRLTADTITLSTVAVGAVTRLQMPELMSYVGFELRASKGVGKFLDSAYLARLGRQSLDGVFQDDARLGVVLLSGGLPVLRTGVNAACHPEIWIDGFEVTRSSAALRIRGLGADLVYGVEVYASQQVPSAAIGGLIGSLATSSVNYELSGDRLGRQVSTRQRPCGAIAIWTRAVVEAERRKQRKYN
jgi:hypothetical protein